MNNIFEAETANELTERISRLTAASQPLWGRMNAAQMFAHCNVAYEMAYEDKHKKPNALVKFMLTLFVKDTVVGSKPYKKNSRTAPAFVVNTERDFEKEKNRLIGYIKKTQELGAGYFDGKESLSFGKLNDSEWNVLFYKHLDHHLRQFGV